MNCNLFKITINEVSLLMNTHKADIIAMNNQTLNLFKEKIKTSVITHNTANYSISHDTYNGCKILIDDTLPFGCYKIYKEVG